MKKDKKIEASDNKVSDEVKESKCVWPGCSKEQVMTVALPVMKKNDKDEYEHEEDISIPVPTCDDHMFSLMSGYFMVFSDSKLEQCHINGPFDIFNIANMVYEFNKAKESINKNEKEKEANKD